MKLILGTDPPSWQQLGESKLLAKAHGLSLQQQIWKHPITGKEELFTEFTKNNGLTACTMTRDGKLLMIREFCQAVGAVVWKFPATTVSKGETMAETMAREVREETGYAAGQVYHTSPGGRSFLLGPRKTKSGFDTFTATDCVLSGEQQLDPIEAHIAVYEATPAEYWELFRAGEVRAIETVMAAFMAVSLGQLAAA